MSEVAEATVPIFPTFVGFRSAVVSEADTAGDKAGSSFGSRFGKGVLGAAKGVAVGVGSAIAAATGVAAVGVGAIFKKGLDRSLNIQDATKQLEGLGHSAGSVETIMNNALASVKGTAFGLDTAATLAATVVAAGVKPGQELERTLKLTADAATIAKTGLGEMGDIIGKVASSGKLTTDVLNQFSQRGVPLLQFVAKQYGVTAEEASKMVSKGKVDFANFQNALEQGVGGAALSSGETARGAFKNIGAAFGRLGAMFAQPAVEGAPTLFRSIAGAVDRAGEALKPYAAQFGQVLTPALASLAKYIDGIDFGAVVQKVAGAVAQVRSFVTSAVDQVRSVFSSIGSGDMSAVGDIFGQIGVVLRPLFPLLVEVGKGLGGIAGSAGKVISAGLPLLVPLLEAFANVLNFLGEHPAVLAAAVIALAGAFGLFKTGQLAANTASAASVALAPLQIAADLARTRALVANTNAMLANRTAAVTTNSTTAAGTLLRLPATASILANTVGLIANRIALTAVAIGQRALAAAQAIATAAQWAFNAALSANPIGIVVLAIAALVAGLVWFFTQTKVGQQAWAAFTAFLAAAWRAMQATAMAVFTAVGAFFAGFWANTKALFNAAVQFLLNLFLRWTPLGILISNFGPIVAWFGTMWSNVKAKFTSGVSDAVSVVKGLPGKVLAALGDLGSVLFDSGKALIQGFIDGIKNLVGKAGEAASSVLNKVKNFFPHSPAPEGPFSGAGWRSVRKSGQALMEQFTGGVSDADVALFKNVSMGVGGSRGQQPFAATAARQTPRSPLIGGDFVLQSTGRTNDDLDNAMFRLRQLQRGGR